MALTLPFEFSYGDRPEVAVRLRRDNLGVDTWAMLDTGATVSLVDAEVAALLGVDPRTEPERRLNIRSIGGDVRQVPCWEAEISVLPEHQALHAVLHGGLLPGPGRSVGNLLGRDFLRSFHFGLAHGQRRLYLGHAVALGS